MESNKAEQAQMKDSGIAARKNHQEDRRLFSKAKKTYQSLDCLSSSTYPRAYQVENQLVASS